MASLLHRVLFNRGECDALGPAADRIADAIAELLLEPGNGDRERHAI